MCRHGWFDSKGGFLYSGSSSGRAAVSKTARFTLEHMTKAKDIIEHRTAINDIVNDVSDGLRESKGKALNALKDWLE